MEEITFTSIPLCPYWWLVVLSSMGMYHKNPALSSRVFNFVHALDMLQQVNNMENVNYFKLFFRALLRIFNAV